MHIRDRSTLIGILLIALLLLMALIGSLGVLPDPNEMKVRERLQAPSLAHPLGTDQYGRDVLSRIVHGSRSVMFVGGFVVLISSVGGLVVGSWAGLRGGWVDESAMRVMDAVMAFPGLLLAIMVISVLGPGMMNVAIAVGIANIPVFARLIRAEFLRLREKEFVEAARALGATEVRVITIHILPNALGPILVQMTVAFATAILAEAALSYLGLGTQPPDPSWGRMLKEAQIYMGKAPWLPIAPGVALTLVILGVNLLGDGVRNRLSGRR